MSLQRVLLVSVLVVLAGCASGGTGTSSPTDGGPDASPTTATTDATPTESTGTTASQTSTAGAETPTDASTPVPTDASWTPPDIGERTQVKTENASDRFMKVSISNKVASGNGYSDFDVTVFADTRMPGVDPDGGPGEPFFIVKINGELVARTDEVAQEEQAVVDIPIPKAALQQFDAGTLDVRVTLMDSDKQFADKYKTLTTTVEYRPEQ